VRVGVLGRLLHEVLQLPEIRYFDINGEYTGLASKAMSAPDGLIRIPLNEEARQGGGQIEEFLMQFSGEGIQHIALLCDNLLDALDRVQMAGIPLLTAPNDIYYANLEKRLPGHGQRTRVAGARHSARRHDRRRPAPPAAADILRAAAWPGVLRVHRAQGQLPRGLRRRNFGALFESMERDQINRGSLEINPA
jgi:4-hydroxyphenylpyruvate dioxygenase